MVAVLLPLGSRGHSLHHGPRLGRPSCAGDVARFCAATPTGRGDGDGCNRSERAPIVRHRRDRRSRCRGRRVERRVDAGGRRDPVRSARARQRPAARWRARAHRHRRSPAAPLGGRGILPLPRSRGRGGHRSDADRLLSHLRPAGRSEETQARALGDTRQERARMGLRRRRVHRHATEGLRPERLHLAEGQRSGSRLAPRTTQGRAVALGLSRPDRDRLGVTAGRRSRRRRRARRRVDGRSGHLCPAVPADHRGRPVRTADARPL